MEKIYKRVPFDIELAKKIQSGEVEGRIVTGDGRNVTILCFDRKSISSAPIVALVHFSPSDDKVHTYTETGYISDADAAMLDIHIELPEEAPKHEFKPFDKVLVRKNGFDKWKANFFSHMDNGYYKCVNSRYKECVLFKGNEHLIGTTENPY